MIISVAHCIEYRINKSTCSKPFSACRQILTRSFCLGTVGQVIGRTFSPSALKRVANGRGYDVIKGIIGVGSSGGDADAAGWRCSGSDKTSGMIGVNDRSRQPAKFVVRYRESSRTWRESWTTMSANTTHDAKVVFCTSFALPDSRTSKEQLANMTFE